MMPGMGCPPPSRMHRRRPGSAALVVLLLAAGAVAGCGGGSGGSADPVASTPTVTSTGASPKANRAEVRRERARAVAATRRKQATGAAAPAPTAAGAPKPRVRPIAPARSRSRATVAKVDASSDAVLAQAQAKVGNAIVSAGAPSDAQVRKEVAEAEKAGFALPSGNTAASFAASAAAASISNAQALAVGASIPLAPWNPDQRPIADWIVPVLQWASQHGWTGAVTSGYRTYLQQAELNAAGYFSAPAGYSNHESTAYPGGAVDVTQPSELIKVLAGYHGPLKLVGGVLGPVDPEHFSATGD
jgi:hypothetical protein